jgi:cytochrome c biogenesis protein CcmG, thiol:disulfide interchange protein DsbE
MKKYLLQTPIIFFLILLFILFYLLLIDRNPSKIPSALLNKNVPEFETKTLLKNKNFISTQEFGNEIIIVNFFATWCKPCRDEHIYIKRFLDEHDLKIIGINYKDNSEKTIEWLNELGNPYSVIAIDKNGKIAIDWGVYGIPETFIIDSEGVIKFKHVGQITNKVYKKISLLIKEIKNDK